MSEPNGLDEAASRLRNSVEGRLDVEFDLHATLERTPTPAVVPASNRSSSTWLVAVCVLLLAVGAVGLLVSRQTDTEPADHLPRPPSTTIPSETVEESATGRLTVVVSVEGGSSSAAEALINTFSSVDALPQIDERNGNLQASVDGITLDEVSNLAIDQMSSGFEIRPVLNRGDAGEQVTGPDGATVTVGPWDTPQDPFTRVTVFEIQGFGLELDLGDEANWNSLARQCFDRSSICPSGQIALLLGSVVVAAPAVNAASFSETVTIAGGFSRAEVRALAAQAIPYAITNIEATWTPPTGAAKAVTITLRP